MKNDGLDVGFLDDSLSCIQNQIAAEHHLASSYAETKDKDWLEVLTMIRRDRSKLMEKIVPKSEAQIYCITKHLSVAMQNYKELANRYLEEGKKEDAMEFVSIADRYEKLIKVLILEKGGE